MEEEANAAGEQAIAVAEVAGPLLLEQNFFLSLIDTMSPTTFIVAYVMVGLFVLHALVLGVFLLNAFFDASLTTASERARVMWRALGGILALQVVIALLLAFLLWKSSGAA